LLAIGNWPPTFRYWQYWLLAILAIGNWQYWQLAILAIGNIGYWQYWLLAILAIGYSNK
jgi:hypothetical protein